MTNINYVLEKSFEMWKIRYYRVSCIPGVNRFKKIANDEISIFDFDNLSNLSA